LRIQPESPVLEYIVFKFLYSHYFLGACATLGLLLAARLRISPRGAVISAGRHYSPTVPSVELPRARTQQAR